MKRTLSLLAAALLGISFTLPAAASGEWNCADMKPFVESMQKAATYINNRPEFDLDQDPQFEKDMDELMEILKAFSSKEGVATFSDAVKALDVVWAKEEWSGDDVGAFRRAMDSVSVNLERIYKGKCAN